MFVFFKHFGHILPNVINVIIACEHEFCFPSALVGHDALLSLISVCVCVTGSCLGCIVLKDMQRNLI